MLAFWQSVDLDALGQPVTWASPERGPARIRRRCARDFTEYWIHQEQIREATGRIDPDVPDRVHTVLDTFLRAVPHTLAGCTRTSGTTVIVRVDGPGGGSWSWRYEDDGWLPTEHCGDPVTVLMFAHADSLWRLCTRMLAPLEARRRVLVTGENELAAQLLQIVSIIR